MKSQIGFGAEWGSLLEGDAKPGVTIEDEIARKKAQLASLRREYDRRLARLQAAESATAAAAADEGELEDHLVANLASTTLRTEAQESMAISGGRMSSLESFRPVPNPKKDFKRLQKARAQELGM